MSRAFDRASEIEERQRAHAIEWHRLRPLDKGGDGYCVDCDEPIDPRRLAAQPLTVRCTEHQNDYERRNKTNFGRG